MKRTGPMLQQSWGLKESGMERTTSCEEPIQEKGIDKRKIRMGYMNSVGGFPLITVTWIYSWEKN